ncbi:hypothetical protein [Ligilactobacillus apodemi]|uniref:hypothetical protein n=1 Tax=Ligilactobacillus apodemi TaxID=307126 RepID=UPI00214BE755|nr:hypothetical protein [Ligilactobacillus apodemi]MCR1900901.1 hypothetical protein [Ligilactobacillus apodemi]MCR1902265.1 hypothetical protein [Ligilactobacillus apodemi]
MKFGYLVAVLLGIVVSGFLPHEEWVYGWSVILAFVFSVLACLTDENWKKLAEMADKLFD